MPKKPIKNEDVDHYIADAADFAKPILKRLRSAFHRGCPEIEETIKWGIPTFEYHGIVGSIAAFKAHVAVGFWRSREMDDPAQLLERRAASMCNIRLERLADMPTLSILSEYVKQAAEHNATQPKKSPPKKKKVSIAQLPAEFKQALQKKPKAKTAFSKMTAAQQRDYVDWITSAKQASTATRRIQTAVDWIAEGKTRNWKYQKKR